MGDVYANFITPLSAILPAPPAADADPKAFWAGYANSLRQFSDETLAAAQRRLLEQRPAFKRFPPPGDCLAACRAIDLGAQRAADRAQRAERARPVGGDAIAYELIQSDMGRRAARDGWVSWLFDFCRKEQRLPDEHEAAALARDCFASEVRWGDLHSSYARTALAAIEARKQKLTTIALGTENATEAPGSQEAASGATQVAP